MNITHPDHHVEEYEDVEYLTDHYYRTHDAEHRVDRERVNESHRDDASTRRNLKHILDKPVTYENIYIPHASELDENIYKKELNDKPVIIGNWIQDSKGRNLIAGKLS